MSSPRTTLVLDFDGTVCLGDDPVLLYAEEAGRRAGTDLRADVETFLRTGELTAPGADAAPFAVEDGYQAVSVLGTLAGLDRPALVDAYVASRRRMAAGEAEMHTPAGFGDFLDDVRATGTWAVLVTNAPLIGVRRWLGERDVEARLDAVIPDAGKPARMPAVLADLLAQAGAAGSPGLLASVGDVYANDVAPAMAAGARGAHIDRFGRRPGPVTWRAPSFVELYPALLEWAGDPGSVPALGTGDAMFAES